VRREAALTGGSVSVCGRSPASIVVVTATVVVVVVVVVDGRVELVVRAAGRVLDEPCDEPAGMELQADRVRPVATTMSTARAPHVVPRWPSPNLCLHGRATVPALCMLQRCHTEAEGVSV
jgi:hypothetical protein